MNSRRCNLRNKCQTRLNSEGVELAYNHLIALFNSLGVGKPLVTISVGFTYGYSHSTPSKLGHY